MTTWGTQLHEDNRGIKTSAQWLDLGDGVTEFYEWTRVADGGNVALGKTTDATLPTGNGTMMGILKAVRDTLRFRRPSDATMIGATSGNVANASAAASLPAVAAVTNFLAGVEITFAGATGALNVIATITGLLGGTRSYICTVPAGVAVQGTPLLLRFDPPIPSSAVNTAIVVTLPALGAGNTHACVNISGYKI